jgi:hypothetical protein
VAYYFKRGGTWEDATEGWPLSDLHEGEDIPKFLENKGYSRKRSYGQNKVAMIEVWASEGPNPYIVFWSLWEGDMHTIYAQTVTELIELLALLLPIATQGIEERMQLKG